MSLVDQGFRSALVTGAGSGLGQAFTDALIAEGLVVWGTSRNPDALAVRERFVPAHFDLEDTGSIEGLWKRVLAESAGIDILVCNAGYGVFGDFADSDFEGWARQVEAMLIGSARLVHLAMPHLRATSPSTIVLVSSLACEFPLPFMSGYNAVKSGLSGFAGGLMIESARSGPTIIDFRPGDYRTSFNQNMGISKDDQEHSDRVRRVGRRLVSILNSAPEPAQAADDLIRALRQKRHGIIRSGSCFQARLAPLFSRLVPENWLRAVSRGYFRIR